MGIRPIGIVRNGVTGRMGMNQHLIRSIAAIRQQGGVPLSNGDRLLPDPILVGRDEARLRSLAEAHGISRVSTDLERALAGDDAIYFDATLTNLRAANVRQAIARGKHVYCEKPLAMTTEESLELARRAEVAGGKHGVGQDKLFFPGLIKLKRLLGRRLFRRPLTRPRGFGLRVVAGG